MTKSIKQILIEMAMPTPQIENTTFYHGYSPKQKKVDGKWIKKDIGHEIIKGGIVKANDYSSQTQHNMTPVSGMAYVTPHIGYAQMYSLGGDVAGHKSSDSDSRYGYLFKMSGKNLKDVHPDEDSIGEMVGNKKGPNWLHSMASKHVSSSVLKKAHGGEYDAYARIGKNLVKKMSDEQKLDLIHNHGVHIANMGDIKIDEAWRIDKKEKQHLLNRDGSNFFEHAERIA